MASNCNSKGLRVTIIDSMSFAGTYVLYAAVNSKKILVEVAKKQLIQTKDIKIKGSATRREFV